MVYVEIKKIYYLLIKLNLNIQLINLIIMRYLWKNEINYFSYFYRLNSKYFIKFHRKTLLLFIGWTNFGLIALVNALIFKILLLLLLLCRFLTHQICRHYQYVFNQEQNEFQIIFFYKIELQLSELRIFFVSIKFGN